MHCCFETKKILIVQVIDSMMYLNTKDDISYPEKMIGWFIEIYQGSKHLSTSIIVVFPNDNTEIETGNFLMVL